MRQDGKYFAQSGDEITCGPIAIMNILAWAGLDVQLSDITPYSILCRCKHPEGTLDARFIKVLKLYNNYAFKIIKDQMKPSVAEINQFFNKYKENGACILIYDIHGRDSGHISVLLRPEKEYIILNDRLDYPAETIISRQKLKKNLATNRKTLSSIVFFVQRL